VPRPERDWGLFMSYKYGQCSATTRSGGRCPTGSMANSDLCHIHGKVGVHRVGVALFSSNGTLNEVAYREYLRSDRWKQKKARRLQIDNYRCVMCGSGDFLECHHVVYSRLGFEPASDLRTLCRSCHSLVSEDEKRLGRELANDRFRTKRARKNRNKLNLQPLN
jgi:hypothetical protein